MALKATLELSESHVQHPALLELRVEVTNAGTDPERFSTVAFRGSVAFEVRDAAGDPVPLAPPPMPPEDEGAVELAPGESVDYAFYGDELFADPPPPGSYRVRFAPGPVTSDWVALTA